MNLEHYKMHSATGLHLPPGARPEPPPNPDFAPSVSDGFRLRLATVADRIGKRLRPYWMQKMRIHGIQEQQPNGQWATIFACYDEDAATATHPYPYRPLDERAIKELCEACLEIRYNTGDRDKDKMLRDRDADERVAKAKETSDQQQVEEIAARISNGDSKRMGKLIRHEQINGVGGDGFREFFPGADLKG